VLLAKPLSLKQQAGYQIEQSEYQRYKLPLQPQHRGFASKKNVNTNRQEEERVKVNDQGALAGYYSCLSSGKRAEFLTNDNAAQS
jgi:hypothetical protein